MRISKKNNVWTYERQNIASEESSNESFQIRCRTCSEKKTIQNFHVTGGGFGRHGLMQCCANCNDCCAVFDDAVFCTGAGCSNSAFCETELQKKFGSSRQLCHKCASDVSPKKFVSYRDGMVAEVLTDTVVHAVAVKCFNCHLFEFAHRLVLYVQQECGKNIVLKVDNDGMRVLVKLSADGTVQSRSTASAYALRQEPFTLEVCNAACKWISQREGKARELFLFFFVFFCNSRAFVLFALRNSFLSVEEIARMCAGFNE